MPKDVVLKEVNTTADGRQADLAEKMVRSFAVTNRCLNRRDKRIGRPAVLVSSFEARYLDKIEGDYGLQLLMNFARGKQGPETLT